MAPVSASKILVGNYSQNLWGRDIRTLYNLKRADAEEFIELVDSLELNVGTNIFPFEELQDALILAKQGKLEQPNAVIRVVDRL
jgi:propanol-preferring alcohol dehydrogenase